MERGLVCAQRAKEFDELHATAPRFGRNNRGARELAGGYTIGEFSAELARNGRGIE